MGFIYNLSFERFMYQCLLCHPCFAFYFIPPKILQILFAFNLFHQLLIVHFNLLPHCDLVNLLASIIYLYYSVIDFNLSQVNTNHPITNYQVTRPLLLLFIPLFSLRVTPLSVTVIITFLLNAKNPIPYQTHLLSHSFSHHLQNFTLLHHSFTRHL